MKSLPKSTVDAQLATGFLQDAAMLLGANVPTMPPITPVYTNIITAPSMASANPAYGTESTAAVKENMTSNDTDMSVVTDASSAQSISQTLSTPTQELCGADSTSPQGNKTDDTTVIKAAGAQQSSKKSNASSSMQHEKYETNSRTKESSAKKQKMKMAKRAGMLGWYPEDDVVVSNRTYSTL